jgi:hypothetical protein
VAAYFDRDSHYAADTFNTLGVNEADSLGEDDLLAVHLLGMDFDPQSVRRLLTAGATQDQVGRLLSDIDQDVQLWDEEADSSLEPARALWDLLNKLQGVGPVTAGKLIARKRPRLIPIYDSEVGRYYETADGEFWSTLQSALRQDDLPDKIERALRPKALEGGEIEAQVTTLRLLDVAVWMRQKGYRG